MSDFFRRLINDGLINDWGDTIDWLFNDDRFDCNGWNRSYIGIFSKRIQNISCFKGNFSHGSIKSLNFPKLGKKSSKIQVIFADEQGIGRSIVKHIRNGIAHGETRYVYIKKELYIEIKDFSDNRKEKQTAYFYFPIGCIVEIYNVYKEIEKSINNNRPNGRKTKDKIKKKESPNA